MDYLNCDEAENNESSNSNQEVEQEAKVETSKSEPSSSVDKQVTRPEFLRSNTEVQEEDTVISGISLVKPQKIDPSTLRPCSIDYSSSDNEEKLESLNSDNEVEEKECLKSEVSNAPVEIALNVKEKEISTDYLSSVSAENSSEFDNSTRHPCLRDCSSSGDPKPKKTSKLNIADKNLKFEIVNVSDEQDSETTTPNLEDSGLHIHKEKLLILHQELKQFHSNKSKDCSELIEPETESTLTGTLQTASDNIADSIQTVSSLPSTSTGTSQTASGNIEDSLQTVSSLPSTSSGFSGNLGTPRPAEIPSASLQSHNPTARVEVPIVDDPYDRDFDELNGVISNKFSGAQIVMTIIPIFEHLLNDLLELKAFLDGTGRASCDPCDNPDYGPSLDERILASITEEFGTGVESAAAQSTRAFLSGMFPIRRAASTDRRQDEPRAEAAAAAEGGCESPEKFDKETEITEQETGARSLESEHRAVLDSTSTQESTEVHRPALDPRLETETDHSSISRQLLRLNRVARRQLHRCITTTREVVAFCVTSSPPVFLRRLERFVTEILDVLEHLVTLRQECSDLLNRCRNREDSDGVLYILKVKTQIAAAYNKLLQTILTLTSNFNARRDSV